MIVSRPLHIRESPHTALRPRVHSARRAHAYDRQERRCIRRDVRKARRRGRNPQRAQRPGQLRQCIRRVLYVCVCARASGGGTGVKKGKDGGHATHCESCGPAVEPRGDLGVLVGADRPGRRTQVKIEIEIFRRHRRRDVQRRR